jgi:hypothetical protein
MSKPDGWDLNKTDLINKFTDGWESIQTGMKELQKCGYLFRTYKRNTKQQMECWGYYITELPKTNQQAAEELKKTDWNLYQNDNSHSKGIPHTGETPTINNKDLKVASPKGEGNGFALPTINEKHARQTLLDTKQPKLKMKINRDGGQKQSTLLTEGQFLLLPGYTIEAKELFVYWNTLGKPIPRHLLDIKKKVFKNGLENLDYRLNQGYKPDQIKLAMKQYRSLINLENPKTSFSYNGMIVSLGDFMRPSPYLKDQLKKIKIDIKSWFEECLMKWDDLEAKYGFVQKDKQPDITASLKYEWPGERKVFTIREENILRKIAERSYDYFINVKDFRDDTIHRHGYPATCAKLIWRMLSEKKNYDFGVVPYWAQSEDFFKIDLDLYLREIGYIVPGCARASAATYERMVMGSEYEKAKKEESGMESLTDADFI